MRLAYSMTHDAARLGNARADAVCAVRAYTTAVYDAHREGSCSEDGAHGTRTLNSFQHLWQVVAVEKKGGDERRGGETTRHEENKGMGHGTEPRQTQDENEEEEGRVARRSNAKEAAQRGIGRRAGEREREREEGGRLEPSELPHLYILTAPVPGAHDIPLYTKDNNRGNF